MWLKINVAEKANAYWKVLRTVECNQSWGTIIQECGYIPTEWVLNQGQKTCQTIKFVCSEYNLHTAQNIRCGTAAMVMSNTVLVCLYLS